MPQPSTSVIEVRYLSMNHTHIQVEHVDQFDIVNEYWIALSAIHSEFNIFDDIMDLAVEDSELRKVGLDV